MSNPGGNTTSSGAPAIDPYKAKNVEKDVSTAEKIEALVKFAQANKFGMMTTRDAENGLLVSRCMSIAAAENGGIDLLFHTNTHSGKTHDLATDAHINISFLNSSNEWASISGQASVITDRELVRKYYSPQLRAWVGDLGDGKHDGGPEDPRIGVIRAKMLTATYALVSKGGLGRTAEVARGILTGEAASTNTLREISQQEVETYRMQHAGESSNGVRPSGPKFIATVNDDWVDTSIEYFQKFGGIILNGLLQKHLKLN